MKLAILGPGQHYIGYSTKRLLEEGQKLFEKTDLIPLVDVQLKIDQDLDLLYKKSSILSYDYFLPRIDSKRAIIGYPVMRFLDARGLLKPYPAETIIIAHNKFLTLEALVRHGVRVPKTLMTGSKESAKEIIEQEGLPIVLKLLAGFGGEGVMFMDTKQAAVSAIETLKTLKQEILVEEYLENPGEDVRGILAGDEIIASYKRIAAPHEKKANIHSGGRAVAFKLTPEMEEIVFKSSEAVKSKILAVDMIPSKDGVYVVEVNINPGLQGIEKATGINVAQRLITYVHSQLKK